MEQAQEEKIKILYVDDEPFNLQAFKAYFRRHPQFEIFIAESGLRGFELFKNQLIHVVISDQKMPDMTGVDFLEKAKKEFPNIVTIIVTGQRELDMIEDAQREGKIFDFHDKPWDLEYLEKMILRAYEQYSINIHK